MVVVVFGRVCSWCLLSSVAQSRGMVVVVLKSVQRLKKSEKKKRNGTDEHRDRYYHNSQGSVDQLMAQSEAVARW